MDCSGAASQLIIRPGQDTVSYVHPDCSAVVGLGIRHGAVDRQEHRAGG